VLGIEVLSDELRAADLADAANRSFAATAEVWRRYVAASNHPDGSRL